MQNQSLDKTEVFFALALRFAAKNDAPAPDFLLATETGEDSENEIYTVARARLTAKEAEKFQRLQAAFQDKSAAEKTDWCADILEKIGTDEHLIDETIHWSHVNEALQKEISAVREIVYDFLPTAHRKAITLSSDESKINNRKMNALEKTVRRAFAEQFVALRDLPKPTAFDRLNGAQTARLIRLSGIREVALACLQIEAVELVAAFLRRFTAEDAQAVAAQLNSLPKMSDARLEFAGQLVHTTLEIEPQPSAMLDLLGINLIGIALGTGSRERAAYTNQKLPLEVAPQLSEIIEAQRRHAPDDLRRGISAEVEHTAQTIFRRANEKSSVVN